MKIILSILLLMGFMVTKSQELPKEYNLIVNKADSLFKAKDFAMAASTYSKAFNAAGNLGKIRDRYKAACCYSLSNNIDSAFYQLNRIVINGKYTDYDEFEKESSFIKLHTDKRWVALIDLMRRNDDAIRNMINDNQ